METTPGSEKTTLYIKRIQCRRKGIFIDQLPLSGNLKDTFIDPYHPELYALFAGVERSYFYWIGYGRMAHL
jgi:hypothetical protein